MSKDKELQELINEVLISKYNYAKRAIPLIENLGENFQEGPSKEDWNSLTDLFEGIGWIIETLEEIDSIKSLDKMVNDYETWNEYVGEVSKLNLILPSLNEDLEGKDNVLIGDMLIGQVAPVFEEMREKLEILRP